MIHFYIPKETSTVKTLRVWKKEKKWTDSRVVKRSRPWADFYCTNHSLPSHEALIADLSLSNDNLKLLRDFFSFFFNCDDIWSIESKTNISDRPDIGVFVCLCIFWRYRGLSWWLEHRTAYKTLKRILNVSHSLFLPVFINVLCQMHTWFMRLHFTIKTSKLLCLSLNITLSQV